MMGFKERGGNLVTEIIANVRMNTLREQALKHVAEGTTVSPDELLSMAY